MAVFESVPADWRAAVGHALDQNRVEALERYVATERASYEVYPAEQDVFRALRLTPMDAVRAMIVGQDPYQRPGLADGLAFSVRPGSRVPPSLRNILRELEADLGHPISTDGSLVSWAEAASSSSIGY